MRVPASAGPSLLSASARSRGDRRERLAAWGHAAVKRLRHLGLAIDDCEVDDGGLLFVPDSRLTLTLDARGVEVALALPSPDLQGLRALLREPRRAAELALALQALPEQFAIGDSSGLLRTPAHLVSADDLRALLERADARGRALWLGWSLPRDVVAEHAAVLDVQLQDALAALGHIVQRLPASAAAEAARARDPALKRRAGHPRRGDDAAPGHRPRERTATRKQARRRDADTEPDRELELEPSRDHDVPAGPGSRGGRAGDGKAVRPKLGASLKRRPSLQAVAGSSAVITRGLRVRVLEGAFAGKEGLVQELDGHGGARVMLGLLAVRIAVKDLISAAASRARPRLTSSHRRPVPVRS